MRSFKKALKMSGLVFLIVLASFGVGIGGGVPVPASKRKEETPEVKTELFDSTLEKNETNENDLEKK